jgi:hypothetical protein
LEIFLIVLVRKPIPEAMHAQGFQYTDKNIIAGGL